MRNFLINLLFFALFNFAFYAVALVFSGKLLPTYLSGNLSGKNMVLASDGSARRFLQAREFDNVDILILGSSHAYRGYDIKIFESNGFTAYNLGSSAQPLLHSKYIYEKYVQNLNPKILLIDIYPVLLNSASTESVLNTLPIFYEDIEYNYKVAKETYDIRLIHSLLFFNLFGNSKNVKDKLKKGDKYIKGGYVENANSMKKFKNYKQNRLSIDDQNISALKEIVKDARKRGIDVFLFNSPLPKARYNSYTNNAEVDATLARIAPYYNFNETNITLDESYFYDDSHVNKKGVEVYNNWVIKNLKERNSFEEF